eukprot:TRINITY_DN33620_c0_g1_i1.p1 TRINITY_DN33620_c0_g1~~TRINITY_DN33620_c0_g1_i1.p1  ORF type:complete len:324 (+),score=79.32 TRINITY_DN33620_c0_g1_i1:33-974(+)
MPSGSGAKKGANPLKPPKAEKSLADIAEETLEILRNSGGYHADGRHVTVAREQALAVQLSSYHESPAVEIADSRPTTRIAFEGVSSFAAAEPRSREGRKVCVLNFASGKHPGGGFRTGARAQEETLARASGLFPTLTRHMGFYGKPPAGFHTDRMIYSPQVPVIRGDDLALLPEPFLVDIVTAAAVNLRGLKRKKDLERVDEVMQQRVRKLLALCQQQGAEVLVLGAWGTGVFRLDPLDVAQWFRDALAATFFEEVVFAIPDEDKLADFEEVFSGDPMESKALLERPSKEERVAVEVSDRDSQAELSEGDEAD